MTTEAKILQLYPSYMSKIWRIDIGGDKQRLIPRKNLRMPVTSIINKIIIQILSAKITDIETVYHQKIKPFQDVWLDLIKVIHETHSLKRKADMNLAFYDHTLRMVNNDPIFANDKQSIIDTIETLKDFEKTIQSIVVNNRLSFLKDAIKSNEIDVEDLLYSLYGSYLALVYYWIVARNDRKNERIVPIIARSSHKLAISLASYTDTLDIMTNPEE